MIVSPSARAESFDQVRSRVYAEPHAWHGPGGRLPEYDVPIAEAIAKALWNATGELMDRARKTLADPSDFKVAAPKLIHTYGVCAEGTWRVWEKTLATGLLAPREDGRPTEVRAIVRMSMATPSPVFEPGKKRNFGIAVKLFPTQDEQEPVVTRNILTLDQTGLTGDDRPSVLASAKEQVFFVNDVPGTGFLAWLGQRTFEKLDPPSTFRGLQPLAQVRADGTEVAKAVAPRLIHIVPTMAPRPAAPDFRDELMAYGSGELRFDLVLPLQYGVPERRVIGSLELGQPVLSLACDQVLTFHHAREKGGTR